MITEQAQVVQLQGSTAIVQVQRQTACSVCAANKSCGTSTLTKVLGQRYSTITVENSHDAKVGDRVEVGISEDGLLTSALLMYILPLLFAIALPLFIKIFIVSELAEAWLILLSGLGLLSGFYVVRKVVLQTTQKAKYQAIMVRVIEPNTVSGSEGVASV